MMGMWLLIPMLFLTKVRISCRPICAIFYIFYVIFLIFELNV